MHPRRSDTEGAARHEARNALAKRIAAVHSHDPFAARIMTAAPVRTAQAADYPRGTLMGPNDQTRLPVNGIYEQLLDAGFMKAGTSGAAASNWISPTTGEILSFEEARAELQGGSVHSEDEAGDSHGPTDEFNKQLNNSFKTSFGAEREAMTPQEETLQRQAIHFAGMALRDAGLQSIRVLPGTVHVAERIQGPRLDLIKSAGIRLSASVPFVHRRRVASKPFHLNVTFQDGRFSLDSLEKNRQVFAVQRGSLTRILAMEDKKCLKCECVDGECKCVERAAVKKKSS